MLWIAAVLSIVIGMAVGLLGGGGSILTTPLLVYVMDFDPKQAIAASLFVVAVTSFFGLIQHARAKRVRWRTGLIFGGAGMVGAFTGGQIGARLPGSLLLAAFAVMMGATAVAVADAPGTEGVEAGPTGTVGEPAPLLIPACCRCVAVQHTMSLAILSVGPASSRPSAPEAAHLQRDRRDANRRRGRPGASPAREETDRTCAEPAHAEAEDGREEAVVVVGGHGVETLVMRL